MSQLVLYSIPAFLFMLVLELWWTRRHPTYRGYERKDTAASLAMGLGNVAISALAALPRVPIFAWLYHHRIADLGASPWGWGILLFAEDLCYYWFHRLHHEIRFLWAAHVSHHSSRYYNLSTALRQPWLTPFTGPLFWAPLPLLGFSPAMVLTAQAWSLLYQFWLHTEVIRDLGPLEWVLNTPSHHRVHHGKDPQYLDKNHGGIFIVWDRLFGTFAREQQPVTFGLTTDIHTFHPMKIATHEYVAIAGDVAAATSVKRAAAAIFGRPGSYRQ